MKLLNCFGQQPIGNIDDFGVNFLDVYTFSFISFLMIVVFITVKVRNRKYLAQENLEKDILGQEKTIEISGKTTLPFSENSRKSSFKFLLILLFLGATMLYVINFL